MRSFSPFPHGTCPLSVPQWYLALPDGAGRFRQGFSGPALLRVPARWCSVRVRGCHPLRPRFPDVFRLGAPTWCRPYNPPAHVPGFGLARVRSPLLAGSLVCFPFLRVLRCFSSPGRCPDKSGRCRFTAPGCPIRTPTDQGLFAPPRGFSQLTASFVIPGGQGIPHTPFHASCSLPPPRDGGRPLLRGAAHPMVRPAAALRPPVLASHSHPCQ